MQGAAVTRWKGIVPGREAASMQVMRDVNAYHDKLLAEGRITDYAWYLSSQAGDGLFIARGEVEQLVAIEQEPEAIALTMRSIQVCADFSAGFYATGDSVEPMANLFAQTAAQLG